MCFQKRFLSIHAACLTSYTYTLQMDTGLTCYTHLGVCGYVRGLVISSGPEQRGRRAPRSRAVGFNTVLLLIIFITHQSENSTPATLNTLRSAGKTRTHTNALLHRQLPAENSMGRKTHLHTFQKPSVGYWIYNHSRTQHILLRDPAGFPIESPLSFWHRSLQREAFVHSQIQCTWTHTFHFFCTDKWCSYTSTYMAFYHTSTQTSCQSFRF